MRPHPLHTNFCGRVSLLSRKDVTEVISELARNRDIRVVSNNAEGEKIKVNNSRGVTAVISFFDRFASNKFRHAKFVQPARFRHEGGDYKPTKECTAQYLWFRPSTESQS